MSDQASGVVEAGQPPADRYLVWMPREGLPRVATPNETLGGWNLSWEPYGRTDPQLKGVYLEALPKGTRWHRLEMQRGYWMPA